MSLPRLRVAAMMMFGSLVFGAAAAAENASVFRVPDIAALPDNAHGRQVRLGRALITKTYAYIGPFGPDPAMRYAGNDLACGDCHLEAGTQTFGLPLVGLYGDFPRYSARSGTDISIEDRINSCMTRSMNGRQLPVDAPAMQALAAYVKFLSSNVPPDKRVPYDRSWQIPELDRAADPIRGKVVYVRVCLGCHQGDGAGIAANPKALVLGYVVPPLWGKGSFNDGAGMARIITLANFAYANMPPGATHATPALSSVEAWDVAAYVESQRRPTKSELARDFSTDLLAKPVDAPYGPYADDFSEAQHKYGPFMPIRAEIAHLKATQKVRSGD
ncbi:MAG: c-type cytochrome [Methylovirgula sp.]|nr:c-type cytochrome [Methylovirgula sp.]